MTKMQDLIEVDALNLSGMLLWVSHLMWFPATVYETITWATGTAVGVSLVVLNIVKINQAVKKKKDHDIH